MKKNIHVLETNQPSRLRYNLSNVLVFTNESYRDYGQEVNQNIYIDIDEEIKEGDWFITKTNDVLKVQKPERGYEPIGKKIILTTDPTLIADGAQEIDDEFLGWFVKNPTCDFVEVEKQYVTPLGDIVDTCYDNERLNYKIIIPQEEPKQYPMGGFALGNYWHKECVTCKKEFTGDKRDVQCESCAIELTKQFTQEEPKQEIKDIAYWRNNCEEDYLHTPISVLKYIRELENLLGL
jgi:hypothetical protein